LDRLSPSAATTRQRTIAYVMCFSCRCAMPSPRSTHLLLFSQFWDSRRRRMLRRASKSKHSHRTSSIPINNLLSLLHSNREILGSHSYLNMTHASDDATAAFVQHLNNTKYEMVHDWGFKICSLEQQLSEAAEGTGLAFIIFTQAIVELPGIKIATVMTTRDYHL
jgi:hypothetical protein